MMDSLEIIVSSWQEFGLYSKLVFSNQGQDLLSHF